MRSSSADVVSTEVRQVKASSRRQTLLGREVAGGSRNGGQRDQAPGGVAKILGCGRSGSLRGGDHLLGDDRRGLDSTSVGGTGHGRWNRRQFHGRLSNEVRHRGSLVHICLLPLKGEHSRTRGGTTVGGEGRTEGHWYHEVHRLPRTICSTHWNSLNDLHVGYRSGRLALNERQLQYSRGLIWQLHCYSVNLSLLVALPINRLF